MSTQARKDQNNTWGNNSKATHALITWTGKARTRKWKLQNINNFGVSLCFPREQKLQKIYKKKYIRVNFGVWYEQGSRAPLGSWQFWDLMWQNGICPAIESDPK